MTVAVLTPNYNDWAALDTLIRALDRELASAGRAADVLIADDGSPTAPPADGEPLKLAAVRSVEVLHLRRNPGHQRAAIVSMVGLLAAIGLAALVRRFGAHHT